MELLTNETRGFKKMMHALIFTIALLPAVTPGMALAKSNGADNNRSEFNGIIQARPENVLQGEWVIGGRTFIADARTEYDQTEGNLAVGTCAKVHVRKGRVHEIDSEPMRECQ